MMVIYAVLGWPTLKQVAELNQKYEKMHWTNDLDTVTPTT